MNSGTTLSLQPKTLNKKKLNKTKSKQKSNEKDKNTDSSPSIEEEFQQMQLSSASLAPKQQRINPPSTMSQIPQKRSDNNNLDHLFQQKTDIYRHERERIVRSDGSKAGDLIKADNQLINSSNSSSNLNNKDGIFIDIHNSKNSKKLHLSPVDYQNFNQLFNSLLNKQKQIQTSAKNSNKEILNGKIVFSAFISSKLPKPTLSKIWNIANSKPNAAKENSGLIRDDFFVALRLISIAQKGYPISFDSLINIKDIESPVLGGEQGKILKQKLSESISPKLQNFEEVSSLKINKNVDDNINRRLTRNASIFSTDSNASSVASINTWQAPTKNEISRYKTYFNSVRKTKSANTSLEGIEFIGGEDARQFFLKSNLSSKELRKIWTLSDIDKDNLLNVQEFCVAMHLIRKIKSGSLSLPNILPPVLRDFVTNSINSNVNNSQQFYRTPTSTSADATASMHQQKIQPSIYRQQSLSNTFRQASDDFTCKQNKINEINGFVENEQGRLNNLQHKINERKREKEKLDDQFMNLEREHQALTQRIKNSEQEIETLNDQIQKLMKQIDQQDELNKNQMKIIESYRLQIKQRENQKKLLQTRFEGFVEDNRVLEKESENLRQQSQNPIQNELPQSNIRISDSANDFQSYNDFKIQTSATDSFEKEFNTSDFQTENCNETQELDYNPFKSDFSPAQNLDRIDDFIRENDMIIDQNIQQENLEARDLKDKEFGFSEFSSHDNNTKIDYSDQISNNERTSINENFSRKNSNQDGAGLYQEASFGNYNNLTDTLDQQIQRTSSIDGSVFVDPIDTVADEPSTYFVNNNDKPFADLIPQENTNIESKKPVFERSNQAQRTVDSVDDQAAFDQR